MSDVQSPENGALDPVLEETMKQIKAVMKAAGVGGAVALISKSHGNFRLILPDWIALTATKIGSQFGLNLAIRIAEPEKAGFTAHFIYSLRDVLNGMGSAMSQLSKEMEKHCVVEHVPFKGFISAEDET